MAVLRVLFLLFTVTVTADTRMPESQPSARRQGLNPARPHISVFAARHWNLRLYSRRDLSGSPVVELTDDGLRLDGVLVCSWPGGRWQVDSPNMVLGYRTSDATEFSACVPGDLPIISTWGDNGKGASALYIEVTARRGAIVESRWGARRLYFDLNTLPGDPRDPIPDARLKRKGVLGWEWVLSPREMQADYARLQRDPAFKRFITGVRSCFASSHAPECLVPFVASPFKDGEIAERLGKGDQVTANEVVRYAWTWRASVGEGRPIWDALRSCLVDGEPETVRAGWVQLSGDVLCNLTRTPDGWKLAEFYEGSGHGKDN